MNAAIIKTILSIVAPIIKSVITGRAGDSIVHQIELKLIEGDIAAAKGVREFAKEWLKFDQSQEHWFFKAGRPALLWMSIVIIVQWIVINPILIFIFGSGFPKPEMDAIPKEVWWIALASVGLYIPARSFDKARRAAAVNSRESYRPEVVNIDKEKEHKKTYNTEKIED